MNKKLNLLLPLLGIITIMLIQSCNKTEVALYERQANNKILAYKITNSRQELLGAIDHQNNHITVYIPYYIGLDILTPEITLEEGAILIDALGNEVNLDGGIDPVPVGDTVKYTVRGADQQTRTYTTTQVFIPLNQALVAGYTTAITDQAAITRNTTDNIFIYGNFGSTGTFTKYILTDKVTGKQHHDFIRTLSVTPSAAYYTVTSSIVPEALKGTYSVEMVHQGRTTKLPDLMINYSQPSPTFFTSSANYAVGDTITFTPTSFFTDMAGLGVYLEVDRVYALINENVVLPSGFAQNLVNTPIPFEVVEQTRRHVKVIVPSSMAVGKYTKTNGNNMLFYFDYADHTGFGKAVRTGVPADAFEIKARTATP